MMYRMTVRGDEAGDPDPPAEFWLLMLQAAGQDQFHWDARYIPGQLSRSSVPTVQHGIKILRT
jgi:hypothetical protein